MQERWVEVARAGELAPGEARAVDAEGLRLALYNDDGEYLAIEDACPHQGASLSEGTFYDGRVICPRHAWVFDLRTGRCPRDSHEPTAVFATRCSAGSIEVRLPGD